MKFFAFRWVWVIAFLTFFSCRNAQIKESDLAEGNLGRKINTSNDEFFPVIFENKLFFYSEKDTKDKFSLIYQVNLGDTANIPVKTTFLPVFKLEKATTPSFWVNPVTNDIEIFFSALKAKSKTNRDLFWCRFRNGRWEQPQPINELNTQFTEDSPAISADGLALVFVSDRQGGYGKSDLFISLRQPDGKWGKPLNLGPKINTASNEITPFIAEDGTLFFASNGFSEKMGFDIVKATYQELYEWDSVVVLSYPINSRADDISPFIYRDKIYLSSRRYKGMGKYDLYSFDFCGPVILSGKLQAPRNYYLNRGIVELYDLAGNKLDESPVNNFLEFGFDVKALQRYVLRYVNYCLKNSVQEQVVQTPCSDEKAVKLLVDFILRKENLDTLINFENYPFPFFPANYYLLSTKDNLENLRTLFETNILKKDDAGFKIPDNEDFEVAGYVEEVLEELLYLIKTNCSYLTSCLVPTIKMEITIICSRGEEELGTKVRYLGLDVESNEFNIMVKRGDVLSGDLLAKLRAYFVIMHLKQRLEKDLDYIGARSRVVWKINVIDAFSTRSDLYAQKKFRVLLSFVTE